MVLHPLSNEVNEMNENRMKILKVFEEGKEQTIGKISEISGMGVSEVLSELREMISDGIIEKVGRTKWVLIAPNALKSTDNPLIPTGVKYLDYAGIVSKLRQAYRMKQNVLLIGPAGVGKTAAIRKVAEMEGVPIRTTNFSLRTREHHFIGRLDTNRDGTLYFKKGPLIHSMEEGGIWYGDEINTAESDCLVRLDSALDFRRVLEVEDEYVEAHPDFWAVASINPLDRYHPGTKELPGQLLSRFPIRIYMDYPPQNTEYSIVKMHAPDISGSGTRFMGYIEIMNQMRGNSDLPYHPTLRESITLAHLLISGVPESTAITMTLVDVYGQWGKTVIRSVKEFLGSRGIKFSGDKT